MSLGVVRSDDRMRLAKVAGSDPYIHLKQTVQERDQHCCALCSFQARKYQEIAPKQGVSITQAIKLNESDWMTVCQFCQQTLDVSVAADMKSGVLVWLPEISQSDLNNIARAIYVARVSQGPMAEAARKVNDALLSRREAAKQRIGSDDPALLKVVLDDYLEERHQKAVGSKLDGIRLFPLDKRAVRDGDIEFNQFPQILAYWRSKEGPFGGHLPGVWLEKYLADKPDKEAA